MQMRFAVSQLAGRVSMEPASYPFAADSWPERLCNCGRTASTLHLGYGLEMRALGFASHAALWIRELLLPNGFLLRRELVQDSVSHVDHFLIYRAVFGDCVRQRYGDNLICAQSGHAAELATVHHINRA